MRSMALSALLIAGSLISISETLIADTVHADFDGIVVVESRDGSLAVSRVPLAGRTLREALDEESARPEVLAASPNYRIEAQALPSDPLLSEQEHLLGAPSSPFGVDAVGAWSTTTGSPDVVVAVLDSGVRPFKEFAGRLLPGIDFVDYDYDADDPGAGVGRVANTTQVLGMELMWRD